MVAFSTRHGDDAHFASRILFDLENPEQIDARKPVMPSREQLASIEAEKRSQWALPAKKKLNRSHSSPTEFGKKGAAGSSSATAGGPGAEVTWLPSAAGEEGNTRSFGGGTGSAGFIRGPVSCGGSASSRRQLGIQLELHRRGFGVVKRPDIRKLVGANLDNLTGPGQYDTNDAGAMLWQKEDVSNPCQRHISQWSTPPRVSFGKPSLSVGPKKQTASRSPGPAHYNAPDHWDPSWQKYRNLGTSFVRQPPSPGESRFGGLARGLMTGSKGEMTFLGS
eukprot:TRINITY_DN8945_c0_g3_i1.p1 TRINITY_DN8945_c0_g3~~TRINITY_DN8945_c0_g3_i1.p1  ORF type:complete len:294 (+),score=52.54 TRINITY_DN8945_c0_g3_i1:51-884(+)